MCPEETHDGLLNNYIYSGKYQVIIMVNVHIFESVSLKNSIWHFWLLCNSKHKCGLPSAVAIKGNIGKAAVK